jgi:acyl-CoA reductase-like NAD-dependent aldehyde dehydrogenase
VNADKIIVRSPATLRQIAELPVAQTAEVAAAVERGRKAQAIWQQTAFSERAKVLYRLRDLLLDEGEKLADILTAETGRPRAEAYGNELFYLCDAIGCWAKKGAGYLRPEKIRPHFPLLKFKKVNVTFAPRGVIGIISPWNFPLTLTLGEALPAVMAGNAVVIKPSELTPLSARFGAEIAARAGFPENLLQVVFGFGATAEALIDQADMISFTGSVETGKKVMRRAADRLIPVSLELGGKDPMVVLKDADLDRAAGACVWGALIPARPARPRTARGSAGLSVTSGQNRRRVRDPSAERRRDRHLALATSTILSLQPPLKAPKLCYKVIQLPGYYYEPTVLVDVDHSMSVMTEETFGPIIPIVKVKDADDALRWANDSRYGLSASVFSKNNNTARRLADGLQSGSVSINDSLVSFIVTDAPMGGCKESGYGYRHGAEGIRKYCQQKTIVVDRFGLKEEFPWYPATKRKAAQLPHLLNLLCHSGWRHKWRALRGLMKS